MRSILKYLIPALVYLASLVAVAALAFAVVLVLAGPHSDLLPPAVQIAVIVLGWLSVLILPIVCAFQVWKKRKSAPPRAR